MMTAPGTKVYVSWYGRTLEGEVVDGDGFMGMTPVRIPLDGHHPVALFFPQHVYESEELAKMQSSPVNSPNSPRSFPEIPGKTEEEPREISRMTVGEYVAKVYVTDLVQRFKKSHWDEAHNHLRTEYLEEFYQLWRKTHDRRQPEKDRKKAVKCNSCQYWVFTETLGSLDKPIWHCRDGFSPSSDCQDEAAYNDECMRRDPKQRPSSKPVPAQHVPQNKKMRCWRCEHLDFDHILCRQENRPPGEHYCGLHGMARVDPDGPQQNLDHKGGCGFTARKQAVELSLFD